ncbi:M16 family metallopeptidase [Texcoconibacillus texcoconensis]|uniref:Putative Zn-dependent peptidase n=1 Tax=Texcoconibacillus texcoconensis TaxID=1095777 RepID=A0A840QKH5_9BACI|nr:pitrilysin family protein [Texcoconibacillus texcoconensis]MBB5172026.1 putative Zn-dependent peptidase [Texcoconibacillus texcoconensis]
MIQRRQTDKGLRIVYEKNESVRSVSIGIWIRTGSRFETVEQNGISHFLEHMFFKGTEKRSAQDIAEAFDAIGGQVNAFTAQEFTCLYAKVMDSHAEQALDILSDMFFGSKFDEDELNKEKGVVLEEIKMYEDTPDDIVHDLLGEAIYQDHPLGFPILGTAETLKTFDGDALRKYMDQHYHAENVVVSVAGNVDESFIDLTESSFSTIKKRSETEQHKQPQFFNGQIVRKKDIEQAHLCLGFNGVAVDEKDIYGTVLINNVLGGSMSSRLFQEVREKRGLAYSVFSYHSAFLDSGMMTVYAGTDPSQLDEVSDIMMTTIASIRDQGLTDKELTNAKEQLKGNLMLGLESTSSRMNRNGKNELLVGRHKTLDELVKDIENVTAADIKRISERLFDHSCAVSLISANGEVPKILN